MNRRARQIISRVFFLTGFSALSLQVIWQRVISLHSGVDLASATTVVAAFLAGLGFGSLLGGWVADRAGPRRAVGIFAVTNLVIGLYAWASIWLLYDVYQQQIDRVDGTALTFLYNFALVLLPTLLMGMSLPLLSKAVVATIDQAGEIVGRLYAWNTLGAAFGAAATTWWIAGTFGFEVAVRMAGMINILVAATLAFGLRRHWFDGEASSPTDTPPVEPAATRAADDASPPTPELFGGRIWPWFALYAVTGAVALGLEVVFFRLVDGIMKSNSYTFGHVLTIYLLLFGLGSARGAKRVRTVSRPDVRFLWIQFAVGVAALASVLVLVEVLPAVGFGPALEDYFTGPGLKAGFVVTNSQLGFALVLGPLLVMGVPVFLMGYSYPFVQAVVSQRSETLGRRTGVLFASNVLGNVVGTLVVGFVLMQNLGSSPTLRILGLVLLLPGLLAAAAAGERRDRVRQAIAATAAMLVLLLVFPSNESVWAFLNGFPEDKIVVDEDRACAAALVTVDDRHVLTVNSGVETAYPYDEFHTMIGLLPTLVDPEAKRAMALGLGIGATTYGLTLSPDLEEIETVELCGTEDDLLDAYSASDPVAFEMRNALHDPRGEIFTGDGRKHLLTADEDFDIVIVDTLRPQSGYAGNVYSVEFYELVADHLADDGILVQWSATERTQNTVAEVFPYVVRLEFNEGPLLFIASESPVTWDTEQVLEAFDRIPSDAITPELREGIETRIESTEPTCIVDGETVSGPDVEVNRDLFPRDEYFLNNGGTSLREDCGPLDP